MKRFRFDIQRGTWKKIVMGLLVGALLLLHFLQVEESRGRDFGNDDRALCTRSIKAQEADLPKLPCPQKAMVTVMQIGRLGNVMWEYAAVWAVAKKTGRVPYVPRCMVLELGEIFQNMPIPALAQIAHCRVLRKLASPPEEDWESSNADILLPDYGHLPEYVVPLLGEIRQIFKFKQRFVEESQRVLREASGGVKDVVYVGVHVRRGDYKTYLPRVANMSLAGPSYFFRAMDYFRLKYKSVMFVVVSDDPRWCREKLTTGHDHKVVIAGTSSSGQDLAIMAACNHSIVDYGTFGMWGAMLAGGETIMYDLRRKLAMEMSQLMSKWL